jgi:NADPH:quinone reductase
VIAILGGMGRTRNGSYAELVTVPVSNVAAVGVDLDWEILAAVPEVWGLIDDRLALGQPGRDVYTDGGQSFEDEGGVHGEGRPVIVPKPGLSDEADVLSGLV